MSRPPTSPARQHRHAAAAGHDAVRAATSRTRHAPTHAGVASDDPRYSSADPALQRLWLALREVMDPEIPVSLVDLGLIYAIRREQARVAIDVTFTATACPCIAFIREDITERLLREPDVEHVDINEVWDPPWTTARMTAAGRAVLGGFGVSAA